MSIFLSFPGSVPVSAEEGKGACLVYDYGFCMHSFPSHGHVIDAVAMSASKLMSGQYVRVIDQACSVKMAGYWPSSFFVCLWTKTKSRSVNMQKKNEANIQPS